MDTSKKRLDVQFPSRAEATDKICAAMLATAMVDALGGPTEFHRRFTFSLVTTMVSNNNFSLPRGVWTDDTSMTLCLARSLATYRRPSSESSTSEQGGFDEKHQLQAYTAWYRHGTLSAIGRCFDIGSTIRRALHIYEESNRDVNAALRHIQYELSSEDCSGNGSLMRVLPIGLAYWRDEDLARNYARRSSRTTHPNEMCQEACEVWTQAIVQIMQASASKEPSYTKLDLVKTFAGFPYTNIELREALTLPVGTSPLPAARKDQEEYFHTHHPVLRLIRKTETDNNAKTGAFIQIPSKRDVPSSGFVRHTLVAALYCFLATETFEAGAIMAINLGDDADTVGAIYAGLAGTWYASARTSNTMNGIWTERVMGWRSMLVARGLVEKVADELADFSAKLSLKTYHEQT